MSELQRYLEQGFDLSQDQSEQLAQFFKPVRLQRNETHTEFGSRYASLSFVQSGYLRIYRQTESKEVTQWISSPGEFVTDLQALMFNQPARWQITALTDCELYTVSHGDYARLPEHIKDWTKIEHLFLGKCFVTIEERVFSFLSCSAEERYELLFNQKRALFNEIPLQYLASLIGMTPETFSRIRKKMIS